MVSILIILANMFCEFCATAALVLVCCMGCMISEKTSPVPLLQASVIYSSAYTGVLHCFSHRSNVMANPAVTLAAWCMRRIKFIHAILYSVAQVGGALFGFYIIMTLAPKFDLTFDTGLCSIIPHKEMSPVRVFTVEFMLTTFLIMTTCIIWAMSDREYIDALPIRMGFVMLAMCLAGGNLTGASMNPAKAVAFAYFMKNTEYMNVYVAAQLLAGLTIPFLVKVKLSLAIWGNVPT